MHNIVTSGIFGFVRTEYESGNEGWKFAPSRFISVRFNRTMHRFETKDGQDGVWVKNGEVYGRYLVTILVVAILSVGLMHMLQGGEESRDSIVGNEKTDSGRTDGKFRGEWESGRDSRGKCRDTDICKSYESAMWS